MVMYNTYSHDIRVDEDTIIQEYNWSSRSDHQWHIWLKTNYSQYPHCWCNPSRCHLPMPHNKHPSPYHDWWCSCSSYRDWSNGSCFNLMPLVCFHCATTTHLPKLRLHATGIVLAWSVHCASSTICCFLTMLSCKQPRWAQQSSLHRQPRP